MNQVISEDSGDAHNESNICQWIGQASGTDSSRTRPIFVYNEQERREPFAIQWRQSF
jgi:hypothetical protein